MTNTLWLFAKRTVRFLLRRVLYLQNSIRMQCQLGAYMEHTQHTADRTVQRQLRQRKFQGNQARVPLLTSDMMPGFHRDRLIIDANQRHIRVPVTTQTVP